MREWYRNGVIYCLDVESFKDGNGDGVGDFVGLAGCLDYLNGLGVDCLWLLPIFDSPNRDNGYDVRDYLALDPRLGDFGQFARLLEEAEDRGIRVLIDLPFNHTSNEHPWFVEASRDRSSPYHDFYIWSDEKPKQAHPKLIFGERQNGNWAHAKEVDRWYYHTFYPHQPDLNFSNPRLRRCMCDIMRFWLRLGVAGFRLDAVPHMIRDKGPVHWADGTRHSGLRELREFVEHQSPAAVLLAEVDAPPHEIPRYFGDGREIHMLLNFYLCNYLFLAFARGSADPIRHALEVLPDVHDIGQWANFLRNHDELDLERLDRPDFDCVMQAFAPDEDMRLYGRGIRRRLAPMLDDDRRRLELAYSLLLTLPGTPVLRYGDEIAMGEDLSRDGRASVRTLMQWSDERNGGFSSAPAKQLVRPMLVDEPWGHHGRNVTDQRRDPQSFLNWLTRAIHMRRDCPEFGRGRFELLDAGDSCVLAHRCHDDHRFALALHNLGDQPVEVELPLDDEQPRHLLDLFGDRHYPAREADSKRFELEPYGYRWFRHTRFEKRGTT